MDGQKQTAPQEAPQAAVVGVPVNETASERHQKNVDRALALLESGSISYAEWKEMMDVINRAPDAEPAPSAASCPKTRGSQEWHRDRNDAQHRIAEIRRARQRQSTAGREPVSDNPVDIREPSSENAERRPCPSSVDCVRCEHRGIQTTMGDVEKRVFATVDQACHECKAHLPADSPSFMMQEGGHPLCEKCCETVVYRHKGSMKRGTVGDRGFRVQGTKCVECVEVLHKGDAVFICTVCDKRTVCGKCVLEGRHEREKSRWKDESKWKSSLLGCGDGHYGLTLYYGSVGYYMIPSWTSDTHLMLRDPASYPRSNYDCVRTNILQAICFLLIFSPISCLVTVVADLLCISPYCLASRQQEVVDEFGLQPLPCWQLLFCRWCATARVYREAAMRGHLQPCDLCPCGPSQEDAVRAFREYQASAPPLPEMN